MNINLQMSTVATVSFNLAGKIVGSRDFDSVMISLPFKFVIKPESGVGKWFARLERFAIYSTTNKLLCSSETGIDLESNRSGDFDWPVLFRCTPKAIAEFERERDGDVVAFRCKMSGTISELEPATAHRRTLYTPSALYDQEELFIYKDQWTKVLRGLGLSASLLIEIPFPLDGGVVDEGLAALSSALISFENGGSTAWKDAVGHLRPFLEEWVKLEPLPQKGANDGSSADRKWKLFKMREALLNLCHLWVHGSAAKCDRSDALLALSCFASLLKSFRSE